MPQNCNLEGNMMINLWIGGYCPTFSPFPFFGGFKHRSIGGQHPIYIRVILEIKKNMLGRVFGITFFPTFYPWTHRMLQQCLTARVHCEDLTSHAQLNPGWLERTVSCLVSVCVGCVCGLETFGILWNRSTASDGNITTPLCHESKVPTQTS